MLKRCLGTLFIGLAAFVILYLGIVALWANSVVVELLQETPSANHQIKIHPRHLAALIRIEDPAFYEHHGLNISKGQGVTTISTVVARDLFLRHHDLGGIKGAFQSFYRMVFDCCKRIDIGRDIMGVVLDSHATKQQQLNLYINNTFWGTLDRKVVVGMEAAAQAYYGKDVSELSDDEFYGIIAMPIAPNRYHPIANPDLHAERVRRIRAVVTGQCAASGWLDLTYDHCGGS